MEKNLEVIHSSPLFRGFDREELTSLLTCLGARRASCQKGEYLLRAGERTGEMGLVLEGSVLIVQEDFWGNRNLVARMEPGQLFGEAYACVPDAVLRVSAVADGPGALLWLDVGRILTPCPNTCARHGVLVRRLLSELAGKNLRLSEKLSHMGKRTTRAKLLSYLSAQAREQGSGEFEIPFSRQQLADYLSVDRSAMCAELGKLRDEGLLRFHRTHFRLTPGPAGPQEKIF